MEHVWNIFAYLRQRGTCRAGKSAETGRCRGMILREMLVDDLDQVMEIEQDLFHVPWTKEGFLLFLPEMMPCFW